MHLFGDPFTRGRFTAGIPKAFLITPGRLQGCPLAIFGRQTLSVVEQCKSWILHLDSAGDFVLQTLRLRRLMGYEYIPDGQRIMDFQ